MERKKLFGSPFLFIKMGWNLTRIPFLMSFVEYCGTFKQTCGTFEGPYQKLDLGCIKPVCLSKVQCGYYWGSISLSVNCKLGLQTVVIQGGWVVGWFETTVQPS